MNRKITIFLFVTLFMGSVIFLWFYFQKKYPPISDDSNFQKSIQELKEIFQDIKINLEPETSPLNSDQNIKEKITKKLLDSLSEKKFIEYQNEIWKIKFKYEQNMNKEEKEQSISLSNEEFEILIEKISSEKNFNSWLSENFDLQKLEKISNLENNFWYQDLISENINYREYYTQIENTIYLIKINPFSDNFSDWSRIEKIVLSLQKY